MLRKLFFWEDKGYSSVLTESSHEIYFVKCWAEYGVILEMINLLIVWSTLSSYLPTCLCAEWSEQPVDIQRKGLYFKEH